MPLYYSSFIELRYRNCGRAENFWHGCRWDTEKIDFIINLEVWAEGKQPIDWVWKIAGALIVAIPSITVPVRREAALGSHSRGGGMNNRQKMGYNAAEALNKKTNKRIFNRRTEMYG